MCRSSILLSTCLAICAAYSPGRGMTADVAVNPRLVDLESNQWLKLHEQKSGDAVRFDRQAHGGSCFDTRRERLILFGSNTHGRDWTNCVDSFDPVAERWTRSHEPDPRDTYAVTVAGIPVAGEKGDRPWAMHTFGTLAYDPRRDEMIVGCWPGHMIPGRFTDAVADLWPKIEKHPTWTYRLESKEWRPLDCEPVHFFPNCAVFDSDRGVMIGYRSDGLWELSGKPRKWKRLTEKAFLAGWHQNAVYDSREKAVVVFGMQDNANDVEVYRIASKEHRLMPTPGERPPKDQHNPMAYVPGIARTVVIVDRKTESDDGRMSTRAECWLYDLATDRWERIESATLPFGCGMNYTMEYDPRHDCVLLVTGTTSGRSPTTVWALRPRPAIQDSTGDSR